MKIHKIAAVLILLFFLVCGFSACSQNNNKSDSKKTQSTESIKLENLKQQKQKEADSLKKEIELLQQKKDSVNKALENVK
ncbi:MAG: hypothetical protein KKB34_15410 [Bacteroidetes bacterium]|jgi:uncharacterized protein YlxW (UPF0749 family)|nr:hypothetical protein [Bacteroidota bacterium]